MEENKNIINHTINKASDAFIEPFKQRLSNPIAGSFFVSFLVLNWKPIAFMFFSNKTFDQRIELFDSTFYGSWYYSILWFCIFPALLSFVYVAILPFVSDLIDDYIIKTKKSSLKREHELKKEKYEHEIEYANQLFEYQQNIAGTKQIGNLNSQIQALKLSIEEKDNQITVLQEEKNADSRKINEIIRRHSEEITTIEKRINNEKSKFDKSESKLLEENENLRLRLDESRISNDSLREEIYNYTRNVETLKNEILNISLANDLKANMLLEKDEIIREKEYEISKSLNKLNSYERTKRLSDSLSLLFKKVANRIYKISTEFIDDILDEDLLIFSEKLYQKNIKVVSLNISEDNRSYIFELYKPENVSDDFIEETIQETLQVKFYSKDIPD